MCKITHFILFSLTHVGKNLGSRRQEQTCSGLLGEEVFTGAVFLLRHIVPVRTPHYPILSSKNRDGETVMIRTWKSDARYAKIWLPR